MTIVEFLNGKKTNISLIVTGIALIMKAFGIEFADTLLALGGGGLAVGGGHKIVKGSKKAPS